MLDRVAGHVVGPERESEVLSGKELYLERRYLSKNLVKLTLCCVDSGASGYIWEPCTPQICISGHRGAKNGVKSYLLF